MATAAGPAFSTPDTHIFEDTSTPAVEESQRPQLSEEQLFTTYEIQRTVDEIRAGRWQRIALQFPDHMLPDAPWIFRALSRGLKGVKSPLPAKGLQQTPVESLTNDLKDAALNKDTPSSQRLFILADTSYGSCCVDEVAAEHASADVVVHYGRSCLSPTARLPVIYVFTKPPLDLSKVVDDFEGAFSDKDAKIILMADLPYQDYLPQIETSLQERGYKGLFTTAVIHDTSSPLPNRTVPREVTADPTSLSEWKMFHVSDPPNSLVLTLASRIPSIHIYPTSETSKTNTATSAILRRRYATLTSLTTVPIWGILINTLSVKNYMTILSHIKRRIAEAGKKSYTFVVGKVNAAKVANFSEVGGWVVIGCWESSLFDSKDFWKPVITPFELELALQADAERVWTGEWTSDFQAVLNRKSSPVSTAIRGDAGASDDEEASASDSDDESAPPEFDLRTGRYVSQSRPMSTSKSKRRSKTKDKEDDYTDSQTSTAVTRKQPTDLARIGGVVSPAAEFFREKRSWQGLGSDFTIEYDDDGGMVPVEGAPLEEGRRGIARGYIVGEHTTRH